MSEQTEPGLYGVVCDAYGFDWVHGEDSETYPWVCLADGSSATWDMIPEPKLVRPGLQD